MTSSRGWIATTATLRGTTLVELSIGVVVIGLLLLTIAVRVL
jgi:Tfp pilus assembly protein PilW